MTKSQTTTTPPNPLLPKIWMRPSKTRRGNRAPMFLKKAVRSFDVLLLWPRLLLVQCPCLVTSQLTMQSFSFTAGAEALLIARFTMGGGKDIQRIAAEESDNDDIPEPPPSKVSDASLQDGKRQESPHLPQEGMTIWRASLVVTATASCFSCSVPGLAVLCSCSISR
jgi:hypothetical protein